tara:strand:- start:149 stop:445 length:297 start_codon:yes stop_codon:yes gene_type:complete
MKKFIFFIFSTVFIFPYYSAANENFSVEIEALTLVMEEYNNTNSNSEKDKNKNPSYMAFKRDECNAKVEVTEKNGLQIMTMQTFDVNVCKKEISRTIK